MSEERYRTPPSVDERLIDYPPIYTPAETDRLKELGIKFVSWRGYQIPVGPGFTTEWFDEVAERARERKSIIIAITGGPGEGKTWFGLRFCEIFDRRFDVETQVCFTREELARIISGEVKLQPGQGILIDEAHMATGARHWGEELQKEVVDELVTIRSKGYIVVIIVLHVSMIDKILRRFSLTYHLHMEDRGEASAYVIISPRFESKIIHPGIGRVYLSLPNMESCNSPDCLWCQHRDWCMNMRAVYERKKRRSLEATSKKTLEKIQDRQKKKEPSKAQDIEFIYDHRDSLRYTSKGTIDSVSVQVIFEEEGRAMGLSQATSLAKRAQWEHPDLKPPETPPEE